MSNYKLKLTTFNSVKADSYKEIELDWTKLVNTLDNPKEWNDRMEMPLLKLATLTGEKTANGAYRGDDTIDEIYGIEGDYDEGIVTMEEAAAKAKTMGINLAFYSTGRSTPEAPRWRVLANLLTPVQPEERQYWVGMLNYVLGGILAPESFTLSQAFFYGKIKGSEYKTLFVAGRPIDCFDGEFDPVYPKTDEKPSAAKPKVEGEHNMTIDEAERMLGFISPDIEYFDWLHVGMGLHNEFGDDAFDVWNKWSAKATGQDKHGRPMYQPRQMWHKWSGFGKNPKSTPITIATPIKLAQANGYKPQVKAEKVDAATDFGVASGGSKDSFTLAGGKIEATQANLLVLLKHYQLRYDEFRAAYMGVFDKEVRVLEEADYTRIQLVSEAMGFKKMSTAMIRENVLMVCMNNKFDSGIEWGESLKWDGVERCQNLLHKYFGAEDTPYTAAASMYIASAMGGRLMEPGCKADAAIVLVGSQGAGKTVSINALSPMDDTFAEISLHSRDADLSRLLRGKLIGELAELRGLKSKDAEDIKAWMSRTTEEWTPKYMEFTKQFKRRLTFWGSTNDIEFLNDITGNRRWLPVVVNKPDPEAIKNDREQIWAEAIYIFKNFGVLWQAVQELAEDVRKNHFDEDPLVEEVREFLRLKSAVDFFTGKEIWASTSMGIMIFDRKASQQIKRAMEYLGWTTGVKWQAGKSVRGYVKKE